MNVLVQEMHSSVFDSISIRNISISEITEYIDQKLTAEPPNDLVLPLVPRIIVIAHQDFVKLPDAVFISVIFLFYLLNPPWIPSASFQSSGDVQPHPHAPPWRWKSCCDGPQLDGRWSSR